MKFNLISGFIKSSEFLSHQYSKYVVCQMPSLWHYYFRIYKHFWSFLVVFFYTQKSYWENYKLLLE